MTKKETIYNALGMIEGAVCVSQKNTRDVLMKAIDMIKNAIEEDTEPVAEPKCECDHKWEIKEVSEYYDFDSDYKRCVKYVCANCGAIDIRDE
jgi:hypothetical protein